MQGVDLTKLITELGFGALGVYLVIKLSGEWKTLLDSIDKKQDKLIEMVSQIVNYFIIGNGGKK